MTVFKLVVSTVDMSVLLGIILYTSDPDVKMTRFEKIAFAIIIFAFMANVVFVWR